MTEFNDRRAGKSKTKEGHAGRFFVHHQNGHWYVYDERTHHPIGTYGSETTAHRRAASLNARG